MVITTLVVTGEERAVEFIYSDRCTHTCYYGQLLPWLPTQTSGIVLSSSLLVMVILFHQYLRSSTHLL